MDAKSHPENRPALLPKERFKAEFERGSNRLMITWELRTGLIQFGYWNESQGVGGSVGQRSEKFKAKSFAEAIQKADEALQKFLELDGIEVLKRGGNLFSQMLGHMRGFLPKDGNRGKKK